MALSCYLWGSCPRKCLDHYVHDGTPGGKRLQASTSRNSCRFVNDILELRILFSELMEVMSKDHYEQSPGAE